MKKIVGSLVLFLLVLGSCKKNNLDINPVDRVGETALWTDSAFIIAYHNELYNAIPHGFYIHMYSKYTDEAYNAAPCCGADVFKLNNFTPDNIGGAGGGDFWGGYMYYWNYGYQYVRKINVFLEKMTDPKTVQYASKDLLVAEAKFLRAFVYFNLLERFGGVPIVTKVYGLGDQEVFKRNTIDEVVAFIEKDLNEAIPVLPASFSSSNANYGRATQDASMRCFQDFCCMQPRLCTILLMIKQNGKKRQMRRPFLSIMAIEAIHFILIMQNCLTSPAQLTRMNTSSQETLIQPTVTRHLCTTLAGAMALMEVGGQVMVPRKTLLMIMI
jgi:hypothetical protein